MEQDYKIYQDFLWDIPTFLYRYMELDIVQRLKEVSFLCGMDYASKNVYNFSCKINRYDHSVNVARITWRFTHDKKATIAALMHDIATPVFSHVIDYMNGDYIKQESTEEKTHEILASCEKFKEYLEEDCIQLEEISDFKRYPIVDNERPKVCADRLDGTLLSAMAWANIVDARCCKEILESIIVGKNEDDEDELSFDNRQAAEYFMLANDKVNELTHSDADNYMMNLLAKIVKRCIDMNYLAYNDLFRMTEPQVVETIENHIQYDMDLASMWLEFKTIDKIPKVEEMEIRNKCVNPLIFGRRLTKKI